MNMQSDMSHAAPARGAWRRWLASVLLPLLLAACGGGGGGSTSPPVSPSPAPGPSATLGHPRLTPTADSSRQSTLTIGPAGGELSARAHDGSRYRLVVPPGALASPTEITMRPVDAIGGLPLTGGLRAAVELLPAGLSFAQTALLIIAPATTGAGVTAGFGWSGPEDAFNVMRALRSSDGTRTSFQITHFSGYGVALPGPSELEGLYADLTALFDEEEPFRNEWAVAVPPYLDSQDTTLLFSLFVRWHDQIVSPLLADAHRSPADAMLAHHALETWLIYVSLFFNVSSPELSEEVRTRYSWSIAASLGILASHFDNYTRPRCSATVPEWKDWLRVPEQLRIAQAAFVAPDHPSLDVSFLLVPEKYCVSLELRETTFPASLDDNPATVPLSFSTVVMLPDGTDVPVPGRVALTYSDGLTGEASLDTSAGGALATLIDRNPLGPLRATVDVVVTETDAARPDVLRVQERFTAGTLDIYFAENLDPAPRPILDLGESADVCAYVAVGPPVGQTVTFELTGQGALSATSAVTVDALGVGQACVTYTSPYGFVSRNTTFEIKATASSPGGPISDILRVYPLWVVISLETDVGLGRVNATNQGFVVDGDGPFAVRAEVWTAGDTTADPPEPAIDGVELLVTTAEPVLVTASSERSDFDLIYTNDAGVATFQVALSSGSAASHTIEVSTAVDGDDVASGASVSFYRSLPTLEVQFNSAMPGRVPVPLIVRAISSSGSPHSHVYIELEATDGSVGTAAGYTNAQGELRTTARLAVDSNRMTLSIRARRAPGAEIYDSREVTGVRVAPGFVSIVSTEERSGGNSVDAQGNSIGDGQVFTNEGYGERTVSAAVGGSATGWHQILGDASTGVLELHSRVDATAGVGYTSAYTNLRFLVSGAPVPVRLRAQCSGSAAAALRYVGAGNFWRHVAHVSGLGAVGSIENSVAGRLETDLVLQPGIAYTADTGAYASLCVNADGSPGGHLCEQSQGSCSYDLLFGDAIP